MDYMTGLAAFCGRMKQTCFLPVDTSFLAVKTYCTPLSPELIVVYAVLYLKP
jgi:hypothetical protein